MEFYCGIEIIEHITLEHCQVMVASVRALASSELLEAALSRLSKYRCDKTLCYRYEKGKMLSAGVGLLLDYMLRERGLRERDMEYVEEEHGKPAFVDHPGLHFNLSHSDTMVACALCDTPVGVDIQSLVTVSEGMVRYVMSDAEIAVYETLADEAAKQLFFTQLWTLKESYAKVTGRGLTHEFPSFEIKGETVKPLSPLLPGATFSMKNLPSAVLSVAVMA